MDTPVASNRSDLTIELLFPVENLIHRLFLPDKMLILEHSQTLYLKKFVFGGDFPNLSFGRHSPIMPSMRQEDHRRDYLKTSEDRMRLISVAKGADLLGIAESTLRGWLCDRRFPFIKVVNKGCWARLLRDACTLFEPL